jgi:hypothetical protein
MILEIIVIATFNQSMSWSINLHTGYIFSAAFQMKCLKRWLLLMFFQYKPKKEY